MKASTWLAAAALLALPAAAAAQDPQEVGQGASVWANNCTRCHNARPSAERSDAAWATIVAHMRARANLTRTDARRVAAFLQATNGPPIRLDPDPEAQAVEDVPLDGTPATPLPAKQAGRPLTPAEVQWVMQYLSLHVVW